MKVILVSLPLTPHCRSISWLISFYVISLLTLSSQILFGSLVPFFMKVTRTYSMCYYVHKFIYIWYVGTCLDHWHTLSYDFIDIQLVNIFFNMYLALQEHHNLHWPYKIGMSLSMANSITYFGNNIACPFIGIKQTFTKLF